MARDRAESMPPGGRGSAKSAARAGEAGRPGDPLGSEEGPGALALEEGLRALAAGRWDEAVAGLSAATGTGAATRDRECQAWEGLSEALWWTGRVDESLAAREQAYAGWRALGRDAPAARAAAWLAREYAGAVGNPAAARGWLVRAETMAQATAESEAAGWVALTQATLAGDPGSQTEAAGQALDHARAARDGDLEVLALGRLGVAAVADGRLEDGFRRLDEALAAATGGEADLPTLATLCCDLVLASELSGELERFAQWNGIVESLAGRHGHPPLIAFCASCCAESFCAAGDWRGAENQLRAALEMLRRTGHRARCLTPAVKLAELMVDQGRYEEAAQVLRSEPPDAGLLVRARLALAHGDPATAVALARRHCRRRGGPSLLTAPALCLLVDAHLAAGDHERARSVAGHLRALGERAGHRRTLGRGLLAEARTTAVTGDTATARSLLEAALDHLTSAAPGDVETARAHLQLARLSATAAPQLAVDEATAALSGFEAAGATQGVDEAAALLRRLGDHRHVGAKKVGTLTRREQTVLRLVAQGLTNAEIAERLFISPKTAGNHVSSILSKLGARSRTQAAAHAALIDAD